MSNEVLHLAKAAQKDEFYTQLSDIEQELRHYKEHFKDKIVFCNCDDPFESNFVKYFALNFNFLGLKKLIATSYVDSPIAGIQLPLFEVKTISESKNGKTVPYKIEITEVKDYNQDGATDLLDIEYLLKNNKNTLSILEGDGDFRSIESLNLLQEADIVVTNPPFSLFREFVKQLIDCGKNFIIIGPKNAITYKDIFRLILEKKLWLGNGFPGGNAFFKIPDHYSKTWANGVFDPKTRLVKFRNVGWFTNLDFPKRHQTLTLYKRFDPTEHSKYDNYDAINVDRIVDIPYDYEGELGVPITFLDVHNPDQFEIIGLCASAGYDPEIVGLPFKGKKDARPIIDGVVKYARVFIIKK